MSIFAATQTFNCEACLKWGNPVETISSLAGISLVVANLSIPTALIYYIFRKKQLEFKNVYLLVSIFLISAALYNFTILYFEHPRENITIMLITFTSSLMTIFASWRIIPHALATPTLRELQILNERNVKILSGVLENTRDAFITIAPDSTVLSFNRASEKFFDNSFTSSVGTSIFNLLPELKCHPSLCSWPAKGLEMSFTRPPLQTIHAEVLVAPIHVSSGDCYSIVIRDISAKKEVETKLHEALSEAMSATKAKSIFLANMSHELRTPLNSVIGMAEVMNETPLTHEQQHYINILLKSGRNLLSIINDVLDLSKIEANRLKLELLEFDLEELILEVIDLLAIKAHEKGIDLNYYIEPTNSGRYLGDPGRIKQVLINLINNAIKFTKSGEVNVWVKDSKNPEAPIEFTVEDTGIGIDVKKINQIFEDFNQLDTSITREFGGTGLGLSISRKLVEMMGGTISVSSSEKQGSLFSFNVQISRKSKAKPLLRNLKIAPRAKIIICEPNQTAIKILNRQFAALECELFFTNHLELCSMVYSQTFRKDDIFIVAIGPDVNQNLKLANDLISHGLSPTRIICSLNIDTLNYARIKAHTLGIDNFITRPYRIEELVESINRLSEESATTESRRKSLLIIDDDTDVLETIRDGAMDLGIDIVTVNDPLEALSVISKKKFDLILCDYKMPVINGQEIYEKISQSNHKPQFIFITSVEPNLNNGPHPDIPILKKPFTHKELSNVINESLFGTKNPRLPKENIGHHSDAKSRILIVDDSEENRELMLAHLKALPHNVDFAENGDVAVKMFKKSHYDLILMDIQMPVLDGYQATRQIRDYEESHHLSRIPIVALTANALEPTQEMRRSSEAGCDDHLTKPILKNTLYHTIKHHLGDQHEGDHRQKH